jgi:hypothetical protein
MKRLIPSLLALSAIATTGLCHLGFSLQSAHAAASLNAVSASPLSSPGFAINNFTSHPILMARRLGFRFNVRASRYRRGGFLRSPESSICPSADALTSVTPHMDSDGNSLGEQAAAYLTASARPMFLFHIDSLPATRGKLVLEIPQEDSDLPLHQRIIHETNFTVSGESGIVGVQVPDDAPPLEVGSRYVWKVSLICDSNNIADSVAMAGGVVERVADTTGTPSERLSFYMNQGIWQDTVSLMAEGVYTNPSDGAIAREFSNLLEDAGLGAIAQAPVVQIIEGQ